MLFAAFEGRPTSSVRLLLNISCFSLLKTSSLLEKHQLYSDKYTLTAGEIIILLIKPQINLHFISNNWEEVSLGGTMLAVAHPRLLQGALCTLPLVPTEGALGIKWLCPPELSGNYRKVVLTNCNVFNSR